MAEGLLSEVSELSSGINRSLGSAVTKQLRHGMVFVYVGHSPNP